MKKKILLFPLGLFLAGSAFASDIQNPLFAYTHLLPSPFTLPAGRLALGTACAFGVTDFLEVGTNLFRDLQQVYNASAELSLVNFEDFAAGLSLSYQQFNPSTFSALYPNVNVQSWQPGAVTAFGILPELALFLGGNLNFSSPSYQFYSPYVQGLVGEADLSWAPGREGKHVGNVISAGVSYDFTQQMLGVGASYHLRGFQFGVHYYPNAPAPNYLPVLSGSASMEL